MSRARRPEDEGPEIRLGPYLDALCTGGVGSRRAAAERLLASVQASDQSFVLEQLAVAPDGARFALVQALGVVGTERALPSILLHLQDPFARAESAEAISLIAQRLGSTDAILAELREPGLGSPWRWSPRARLGDGTWVEALLEAWGELSAPQRIQALESARFLPNVLRNRVKGATADAQRTSGNLRQIWESL